MQFPQASKPPFPVPPSSQEQVAVSCDKTVTAGRGAGSLDLDESTFILKDCLTASHYADVRFIKFIQSFLICRNAPQAGRDAGVSYGTAKAWRLMPDVAMAIEKLTAKSVIKYGFDASDVIERVKEMVEVDPIVFERADGSYVERLSELPPEVRRVIKKFKAKNIYEDDPNGIPRVVGKLMEYELYDKQKAADMLGKEKELFKNTTRVEHDITKNMSDVLLASANRAADRIEGTPELKDVIDVTKKVE